MIVGGWSTFVIRALVILVIISVFTSKNNGYLNPKNRDGPNQLTSFPNSTIKIAFQSLLILSAVVLSAWFIGYCIKKRRLDVDGSFVYLVSDIALCLTHTYFLIYIFIAIFDENNVNHEISKTICIFMVFFTCEFDCF